MIIRPASSQAQDRESSPVKDQRSTTVLHRQCQVNEMSGVCHCCCRHVITCGSDGDVRVYNGFDDNDPVSYRIGDAVYCVCYKVPVSYFSFFKVHS